MSRNKDERSAAASAAKRGGAALVVEQALKAAAPIVAKAALKATVAKKAAAPVAGAAMERLSPVADQAKDRLAPHVATAQERLAPVADAARSKVVPLAGAAAVGSAEFANKTKEQLQPHLQEFADKVQPAVEQAHSKVTDELVPQLLELLQEQLDSHPAVGEGVKRSQAAAAALRGELELPQQKERNIGATVAKVAAASAVLAAAAVAVRQFLASKDDAWTAHQPSTAYTNPAVAEEPKTWVDQTSATPDAKLDDAETADVLSSQEKASKVVPTVASEPQPEERMSAEGGPVDEDETTNEDLAAPNTHGEGSYVGEEPPSEYRIKGNERSMKYHTDDSAGYERTIADVWFNSTEAAEKAGFTKAQR